MIPTYSVNLKNAKFELVRLRRVEAENEKLKAFLKKDNAYASNASYNIITYFQTNSDPFLGGPEKKTANNKEKPSNNPYHYNSSKLPISILNNNASSADSGMGQNSCCIIM